MLERVIGDHPTFCVVEGDVTVPLYQTGERPGTEMSIALGPDGALLHLDDSRLDPQSLEPDFNAVVTVAKL